MRILSRFCAVVALVCAFAFSAYAGDIPCPAVTSEPPQVAGDIQNGVQPTDIVTVTAFTLIETVLALS